MLTFPRHLKKGVGPNFHLRRDWEARMDNQPSRSTRKEVGWQKRIQIQATLWTEKTKHQTSSAEQLKMFWWCISCWRRCLPLRCYPEDCLEGKSVQNHDSCEKWLNWKWTVFNHHTSFKLHLLKRPGTHLIVLVSVTINRDGFTLCATPRPGFTIQLALDHLTPTCAAPRPWPWEFSPDYKWGWTTSSSFSFHTNVKLPLAHTN